MHQQWTMPPRVLQIVAALIGLAAIASFAMGVLNTPQRGGRLPGQKLPGAAALAPIDAEDATPLADERIQGPPPPAANEQADNDDKTEADAGNSDTGAAAPAAASPGAAQPVLQLPPAANATPPQTLGGPPAADEPPH